MIFRGLRDRSVFAWCVMLGIGVAWGITIPLSKIAVSTGHQPFGLIFWQVIIAVLILGSIQLFRGCRPQVNRQNLAFFTVIAFCGTLIPNSTSYLSQQHLPAGVMAIAIATVPMFTLAMAVSIKLEPASLIRFAGILTGFVAMVMIAAPETSLPNPDAAPFLLVALVAPFCYGVESIFVAKRKPPEVDAITILFMASVIGLVIIIPLVFATGQFIDPFQPWGRAEVALIGASAIHVIVYCTFIWLVTFAGPVFSDQAAYPVTISGVFLSILILGESYSGWIWASLVLVMIGLILVQPRFELPEIETKESHV